MFHRLSRQRGSTMVSAATDYLVALDRQLRFQAYALEFGL